VTVRPSRLVLIGVGNRDRGDDGVGPIVCDLLREDQVDGVHIIVFEGAMVDLALHWEPSDHVVIVDASAPNGRPGRIVERDVVASPVAAPGAVSTHAIDVTAAIELARTLDRLPASLTLIGIEVAACDHGAPLSAAVSHAAGRVVASIRRRRLGSAEMTK
jgi:hydrogenase maturation protease